MKETERLRIIAGAFVVAASVVAGSAIYLSRLDKLANDEYTVLAAFPKTVKLKTGDDVIMNGSKAGAVIMVESAAESDSLIAVRMRVGKEVFMKLGPESVAWVENESPDHRARVVIQPGNPGKFSRLVKVKPIRGIAPPAGNTGR